MNRILKCFLGAVLLLGISSCTAESGFINEPDNAPVIKLVKQPEVYAFSGDQVIGLNTFANSRASNQPDDVVKCQDFREKNDWLKGEHPGFYDSFDNMPKTTDRGESVSQAEYDIVMKYLQEHPNEGYDEVDLTTYFLQNVGSAGHTYTTTPDQNGVTHTTGMQMDYFEINGWHVSDYNAQGGPRIYIENWPLENCAYHDSFGKNTFNYYKFYYIPMEDGTYNLYLCFDYATISQQGNVDPDGTYDDWVIKIVPGDGSEITPPNNEEKPENPGTTPETPNTPEMDKYGDNHVEVNLSIEERESYLTSHLSIHVRAITDVEIFIPVPAEYVCEADDLNIVQKHQEDLMVHGGPTVLTYDINGTVVTLTVSIEAEGIRVITNGIDENVINYCKEKNNDGITFEVWNYFNIKHSEWVDYEHDYLDLDKLKEYLNQSTIKFTKDPELYVNAFMYETGNAEYHEGHEGIFCDDCTVSPIEWEGIKSETGYWFNHSPFNELYYNK